MSVIQTLKMEVSVTFFRSYCNSSSCACKNEIIKQLINYRKNFPRGALMIRIFKNLENFYLRKLGRSKKKLLASQRVNMIANMMRKKTKSLRKSLPQKMKSQYKKKRSQ